MTTVTSWHALVSHANASTKNTWSENNHKQNITVADQLKYLEVTGKDIVGVDLPNIITLENTAEEFSRGRAWGRLLRLRRGGNQGFFVDDSGVDKDGNMFSNTKKDSGSKHLLMIAPSGDERIDGNLTVTGTLHSS